MLAAIVGDRERALGLVEAQFRRPRPGASFAHEIDSSADALSIALAVRQRPRLIGQHDRYTVSDRIGEPRFPANQLFLLAIVYQGLLRDGAHENLEQLGIDGHERS